MMLSARPLMPNLRVDNGGSGESTSQGVGDGAGCRIQVFC
jgi:hypothetical protein